MQLIMYMNAVYIDVNSLVMKTEIYFHEHLFTLRRIGYLILYVAFKDTYNVYAFNVHSCEHRLLAAPAVNAVNSLYEQ